MASPPQVQRVTVAARACVASGRPASRFENLVRCVNTEARDRANPSMGCADERNGRREGLISTTSQFPPGEGEEREEGMAKT